MSIDSSGEANGATAYQLTISQRVFVMAGLMLGTSLAALDLLIIVTALSDIASDLGKLSDAPWIFTSYLLGHTIAVMIWGKLGDQFGRGKAFTAAVMGFIFASALAGASQSLTMLIGSRLLQGLAAGGLVALSHGIIGDFVPARNRGGYLAAMTSIWTIASLLGPLLGGLLVDSVGWRWIFYMNLPWGLVAIILVSPTRRFKPLKKRPEIDYRGAVLLMLGLGLLTIGAALLDSSWQAMIPWLVFGFVIMGLFVVSQFKASEPVVPLSMFRHRVVRVASASTFLFGIANFGSAILIPLYAQLVNGVSPTAAGYSLTPVPVGILCSATITGWLIRRTGWYRFYPAMGAAVFAAGVLLLMTMDPSTTRPVAMSFAFIAGLGNGMIQPVVTLAIQDSVPYRHLGAGTALAISMRSLGQTIGTVIIGVLLSTRVSSELKDVELVGIDSQVITTDELEDKPELIDTLTEPVQDAVVNAYHIAIDNTFAFMVVASLLAAVAASRLPLKSIGSGIEDGVAAEDGAAEDGVAAEDGAAEDGAADVAGVASPRPGVTEDGAAEEGAASPRPSGSSGDGATNVTGGD